MIKKTGIKADKIAKPAVAESKPIKQPEKIKSTETQTAKASTDKTTLTDIKNEEKPKNLPNLDALSESFDKKDGEKVGKDDKAEKTEKQEQKKFPPEVQKKIDTLEAQLKEAEKRGDAEAVERLKKQLEELRNPGAAQGGNENGGTPPVNGTTPVEGGNPANGGNNAGGGNPGGGAAPAGGGGDPGGGAAPVGGGGDPGGGAAPAGGNAGGAAPTGGANEANAGQGASSQEVNQFIQFAASAYGVNPTLLSEIARRESNFNTGDIANNWDSNAKKGTPSKGMFQFIEPTFKSFMPQAKQANPQAWQGVSENWTDWKAQALTTAWAISSGKGSHWSTYQSALATAGGNPSGPKGNQGAAMA